MARAALSITVLRHLDRLRRPAVELSDGELLQRFVRSRSESAFAALVERHGPLVLDVCRRILGDPHDAEDAFQATFLVLVRRAESLRPTGLLAGWLHGVASRVAHKARARSMRWRCREREVPDVPSNPIVDPDGSDLRLILDEEVGRLPEKYRRPVILCYLQGRAYTEAARQLGCPPGTISGRLARARNLLRARLQRRGIVLAAPLLGTVLAGQAPAAISGLLVRMTVRTALLFAARNPAGIATSILALTEGVTTTMLVRTLKTALVLLLGVGLLAGGTNAWVEEGRGLPGAARAADSQAVGASAGQKALSETVWADLADTDNAKTTRAVYALAAAGPQVATAYLAERLVPVKVEEKKLEELIADLDSPQFGKRQKAGLEIEYLGKYAKPQLEKALGAGPSAELRKRIEQLLDKLPTDEKKMANPVGNNSQVSVANGQVTINGPVRKLVINGLEVDPTPKSIAVGPSPLWQRAARAVVVLEEIGSVEAKQVLEKLAGGEAEALPTKEAKAALERLGGKR